MEEIERRLYLLREKYNAGAISAEQFETEVEKLHFRDQRGVSWMIGAQSGQWYYHDGKQWVQAEPPRPQTAARPAAPAQGGATATGQPAVKGGSDTQSGNRLQWILFGCVGLTIVLLILAIAAIWAIYLTSERPTAATPTSVALLPVPNLPTPTATFAAPVVGDPTPTLALANDTSVLLQEAKDLMAQSKYEEAVARYKKASELDPSQATIYARWARALRYQYPRNWRTHSAKRSSPPRLDSANVEGAHRVGVARVSARSRGRCDCIRTAGRQGQCQLCACPCRARAHLPECGPSGPRGLRKRARHWSSTPPVPMHTWRWHMPTFRRSA